MTDYLKKKFAVAVGSDAYRDNWERIFKGEKLEERPDDIDDSVLTAEDAGWIADAGRDLRGEPTTETPLQGGRVNPAYEEACNRRRKQLWDAAVEVMKRSEWSVDYQYVIEFLHALALIDDKVGWTL